MPVHFAFLQWKPAVFLVLILFFSSAVSAVDLLTLDLKRIEAQGWQLEGVKVLLSGLNDDSLNFGLSIDKLALPEPFGQVAFVNIHCSSFLFEPDVIACKSGFAEIRSKWIEPSKIPFSFQIAEKNSSLTLSQVKTGGGEVSLAANLTDHRWRIEIYGKNLKARQFDSFYQTEGIGFSGGHIDIGVKASGNENLFKDLKIDLTLKGLTFQTSDGKYASERVNANIELDATVSRGLWDWKSLVLLKAGVIYADPVYLEIKAQSKPIKVVLTGNRNEKGNAFSLNSLTLDHPDIGSFQGYGQLYASGSEPMDMGHFTLQTNNLEALSSIYLEPFFEASAIEGMSLAGQLNAEAEWEHQSLSNFKAVFSELEVRDAEARIYLQGGSGSIGWTDSIESRSQSEIRWKTLKIYNLPIGPSNLSLTTDARSIHLNRTTRLPFLDGSITIHRFDWEGRQGEEPRVHFQGDIQQVSLEPLTTALDATPLSGSVTGQIPGVTYQEGELRLDGELKIRMFDGEVIVHNLVSSGLFGDLPQLYGDVDINRLDLNLITQKFEFGNIQGRLSGYIRNLYLENWEPVTFYAWLGTSKNDDSRHLISQKAVENIASIGGGGAADLVSRSVLRFFDNFGYEKLGIGCYLHNGVCQLFGMEPATEGYYIVKGGGLPRIDVIGYNSRIDWNVLLKRLKRISSSDTAVVE